MKNLATLALIMVVCGSVNADDTNVVRKLAGQDDMAKDYLETVKDEAAAERLRREKDRKDHDKYLKEIARSR